MYRQLAGEVTRLGWNLDRSNIRKKDPDIPAECPVKQLLLKEA
jgi:hypothetical protein